MIGLVNISYRAMIVQHVLQCPSTHRKFVFDILLLEKYSTLEFKNRNVCDYLI